MKCSKNNFKMRHTKATQKLSVIIFFIANGFFVLCGATAQETTKVYSVGNDKLTVYTDVPGLTPSEFYTIKVRSAATNNEWVECFANITRSRWSQSTEAISGNGNRENYWGILKDWSHTYSNIEMSAGSLVQVQIAAKNGFKIKGSNFTKANAHPAHKASVPEIIDNIVYFTISNPAQITVDINGQMDETDTGNGYAGPAVHTVSLYANPIMVKPALNDANIQYVTPGVKPSSNLGSKTTLYFLPGVHDIGRNFTIFANKNYYIPGDAIVYGTLANLNNTTGSGNNIRIYGYGTLSGDRIKHPAFDGATNDNSYRMVYSEKCSNFVVEGLSLMNGPMHTMKVTSINSPKDETFAKWLKIVTWRVNGDGLGNVDNVADTFIRTQDDCVYVKGDRKRCVFWTDANGSIFSMAGMDEANIKPFYIEDIDVIYARNRSTSNNGGRVFAKRSDQKAISTRVDVVFQDIRIIDKFETHETFQILSTGPGTTPDGTIKTSGGYTGITFRNITSVKPPVAGQNRFVGWSGGIWDDITFDNVILGGRKILKTTDFAEMGPFVTNIKFLPTTLGTSDLMPKSSIGTIHQSRTKNTFTIHFDDFSLQREVQLYNALGQMVFTTKNGSSQLEIDVKSLHLKGLVLVKVISDQGISTQKVIVE
jgi:Secretion system C-terminal sorting domain